MWVGESFYKTPEDFIKEAEAMGIAKRIPVIPKRLVLGKTWVLLAHKKVPFYPILEKAEPLRAEPTYKKAIFYAFKPKAIEMLIWRSQAMPKKLTELKKRGITPVIVPNGDRDHSPKTPLMGVSK